MGALLLAAFSLGGLAQQANATLFSLPKSLKTSSPFEGVEMSLPIWGPAARSFDCIEHLAACSL
jgi:hypothetical protein